MIKERYQQRTKALSTKSLALSLTIFGYTNGTLHRLTNKKLGVVIGSLDYVLLVLRFHMGLVQGGITPLKPRWPKPPPKNADAVDVTVTANAPDIMNAAITAISIIDVFLVIFL